jgi:hypothetical protein
MTSSRAPRHPTRPSPGLLLAAVLAVLALAHPVRAEDAGWPRAFDSASGAFVIYQPQPETLDGDLLSCRAAFSLQKSGERYPVFGVLWFTERILVDRDSSMVDARDLDVTRVRLPGITAADSPRYERLVEQEARQWDLSGSLDSPRPRGSAPAWRTSTRRPLGSCSPTSAPS